MGDAHQMVVHHIGEIVGWIAVGFDQDHIVELRVLHRDIPVDLIMKNCLPVCGIVLPDHIGNSRRKLLLHFLSAQGKAVLVIDVDLLARHGPCESREPLLIAETIVRFALFHQFLRVLQIETALLPLALNVGADAPVLVRPFIMHKPCFFERPVDNIHSALHQPLLIGVLYAENKIPALMLCNQIRV